jgi:hypothetical protein
LNAFYGRHAAHARAAIKPRASMTQVTDLHRKNHIAKTICVAMNPLATGMR